MHDAIIQGVERLARPITMTALAAIFGLLPAALSTRIGSQTQRPLAIVVIGGMTVTLLLTNIMPVLYSFYGHREPPVGSQQRRALSPIASAFSSRDAATFAAELVAHWQSIPSGQTLPPSPYLRPVAD